MASIYSCLILTHTDFVEHNEWINEVEVGVSTIKRISCTFTFETRIVAAEYNSTYEYEYIVL